MNSDDVERESGGEEGTLSNNAEEKSSTLSSTHTKHKLNKMMNDFAAFDDNMKIGTRVRTFSYFVLFL